LAEKKHSSRRSVARRRLRLRRLSQVLFWMAFLTLFLWSRREFYLHPGASVNLRQKLINLPLKLDPLVMVSQALASRTFLLGSLLAIVTIVITLLLGRVWCGWFCPLGSLLDWLPLRSWKKRQPSVPEGFRSIKYVLLLVILFSALFTNLTLLILDPLTIIYRTLTTAVWPGLDSLVTSMERLLYRVSFLQPVVGGFDSLIRPSIFPAYPAVYRYGLLYLGFLVSLVGLNLIAPRFWCRYLCPLGGLLGLLGKASLVHCEVAGTCSSCGVCFNRCPTGAIQSTDGVFCDTGECTMCMSCAVDCPWGAISYPAKRIPFLSQPYDLERRKALLSLGTAVVGVSLLESGLVDKPQSSWLIRPPGVINERMLSTCIRCGECSTVCPTNAIQMAVTEAGVEGFWTPVLIPRIGYCDYSCHACGQVCPVEAIPPLPLEGKRIQVIGKAVIDRDRCLPWSAGTPCIVCEEMCPVPDKAIELEETQIKGEDGQRLVLQRPVVIRSACIGCGICENKCPVSGQAAIRIEGHEGNGQGHQYRRGA
jgi:MauM/NapG family ferredoxin protein